MKRLLLPFLLITVFCLTATAAVTDEVRDFIEAGDYQAAMQSAEYLRKKSPRDAAVNYWYGMAALHLGEEAEAAEAFTTAADRGYLDAYGQLVELNLRNYEIEDAMANIEKWRAALRKSKKSSSELLDELEARMVRMANQMDRVEDIPVIARYDISRAEFDEAIKNLSKSGVSQGLVFINENIPLMLNNMGREVFWTEPDEDGISRLYVAGILDDGTRDESKELSQYLGDSNIIAPFILDDGETLYFAAENPEGLGGYDIYMTRRDDEGGFYEPSNIGMPYNSTGDDLLFVIDEENNIGWWATDRFGDPETVSILVFVPNKNRVNVPSDDEFLAQRAKAEDLDLTIPKGFDVAAAKQRIPQPVVEDNSAVAPAFAFSMGDGRIFTAQNQFRNRQAALSVSDAIRARRILDDTRARLESLQNAYAEGDKSLGEDIRELESEIERQRDYLKRLTNSIIRLETTGLP